MTQYEIMLIYSLLLSRDDNIQEFIRDGPKFFCPCQKFHPINLGKSVQIENT